MASTSFSKGIIKIGDGGLPKAFAHRQGDFPLMASGGFADIFSNEDSNRFNIPLSRPGTEEGAKIYLGIGSHQNFDHICRIRPDNAVLVDITKEVTTHLAGFRAALKVSRNPLEFLSVVTSGMPLSDAQKVDVDSDITLNAEICRDLFDTATDISFHFRGDPLIAENNMATAGTILKDKDDLRALSGLTRRAGSYGHSDFVIQLFMQTFFNRHIGTRNYPQNYQNSWLKDLGDYGFIRSLALNGGMSIIQGDISDPAVADTIRSISRDVSGTGENPALLSYAYLSNVENVIFHSGTHDAYYRNLARLPWAKDPVILRSFSYLSDQKVENSYKFWTDILDPFYYQTLESDCARFWEDDTSGMNPEKMVKLFLFRQAMQLLAKSGYDFCEARSIVNNLGQKHFKYFRVVNPEVGYLDIPALLDDVRTV